LLEQRRGDRNVLQFNGLDIGDLHCGSPLTIYVYPAEYNVPPLGK
jgi:hypothetical protein